MEWLNDNEMDKQKFIELRLYAPEDELVLLDFYPLRESDEPDWNPMPELEKVLDLVWTLI